MVLLHGLDAVVERFALRDSKVRVEQSTVQPIGEVIVLFSNLEYIALRISPA